MEQPGLSTAAAPGVAALALWCAMLAPARADGLAPQWTLEAGAEHSRWQERDARGRRLVQERGELATLALQADAACAGLAWQATLGMAHGRRAYQGLSSTQQPITTHSDLRRLQAQVQALLPLAEGWWAGAGLGGQRLWRDIASAGPVLGYPERFTQWQPQLVLAHQRPWSAGLTLAGTLQLGARPGGRLALHLPQADPARLRLGRHHHLQLNLVLRGSAARPLAEKASGWRVALQWRTERTGAGPATALWRGGVAVGAAAQPAFRQDSLALQAALQW